MKTTELSIYVVCLSSYANGILHGKWIDATQGAEVIYQGIKDVLATSPMPDVDEWAIHSEEGFNMTLPESMDIETLVEMAEFIKEHGELGTALIEHFCGEIKDAQTAIEENYHGEHYNKAEFARSLMEDLGQISDHLEIYMDYENLAKDLFINGYFSIDLEHRVHVFSYC